MGVQYGLSVNGEDPEEAARRARLEAALSMPSYDAAPPSAEAPSLMSNIGTGVKAGADVAGGLASIYATYKAIDAAKAEAAHQADREGQADYLAAQDRMEKKRLAGVNEMYGGANYSGDMMQKLMDLYSAKNYNGGYANLHGA